MRKRNTKIAAYEFSTTKDSQEDIGRDSIHSKFCTPGKRLEMQEPTSIIFNIDRKINSILAIVRLQQQALNLKKLSWEKWDDQLSLKVLQIQCPLIPTAEA